MKRLNKAQIEKIFNKTTASETIPDFKASETFLVTDYTILKHTNINRKVTPNYKLKEDLEKFGQLNPVVVKRDSDGNLNVLNGGHRVFHLKELGLPIICIELSDTYNGTDFDAVKSLNIVSRDWTANNFQEHFITVGNENYRNFKSAVEVYTKLSRTILYQNYAEERKGSVNNALASGSLRFSLSEEQEAEIDTLETYIGDIIKSRNDHPTGETFAKARIFSVLKDFYRSDSYKDWERDDIRKTLKMFGHMLNGKSKVETILRLIEKYEEIRISQAKPD